LNRFTREAGASLPLSFCRADIPDRRFTGFSNPVIGNTGLESLPVFPEGRDCLQAAVAASSTALAWDYFCPKKAEQKTAKGESNHDDKRGVWIARHECVFPASMPEPNLCTYAKACARHENEGDHTSK
jgi:hypothetical protein